MRPILFIDRDGVVLEEPATDFQIDHVEKTIFVPGVISNLKKIEFGVSHENRFLMKELHSQGLLVSFPVQLVVV